MKKTAAMYLRCSTTGQVDGSSLERQLRYCKLWCGENDVDVINIVVDVGSGWDGKQLIPKKSKKSGNLGRIISHYENGYAEKPDYFIFEDYDRFSRCWHVARDLALRMKGMGIQICSVGMNYDNIWGSKLELHEYVAIHQPLRACTVPAYA